MTISRSLRRFTASSTLAATLKLFEPRGFRVSGCHTKQALEVVCQLALHVGFGRAP